MTFTVQAFRETQEKAEKADKFLFGNGSPGMDEIMRNMQKDISFIKEFMEEYRHDRKEAIAAREKDAKETIQKQKEAGQYYLRLTVGAALSAIVVLIINGMVYFIKILPVIKSQ